MFYVKKQIVDLLNVKPDEIDLLMSFDQGKIYNLTITIDVTTSQIAKSIYETFKLAIMPPAHSILMLSNMGSGVIINPYMEDEYIIRSERIHKTYKNLVSSTQQFLDKNYPKNP